MDGTRRNHECGNKDQEKNMVYIHLYQLLTYDVNG